MGLWTYYQVRLKYSGKQGSGSCRIMINLSGIPDGSLLMRSPLERLGLPVMETTFDEPVVMQPSARLLPPLTLCFRSVLPNPQALLERKCSLEFSQS